MKDVIARGGENISALEVENLLLEHANIAHAAAIAVPDARLQEKICACVVLKDPSLPLTLPDIREHFSRRKVAKIKYPEYLRVMAEMPATPSGKINKKELARLARAEFSQSSGQD